MGKLSLYTIATEYRELVDRLTETQDDLVAIEDTLEGERYPLEIKMRSCVYAQKNLEATADAIKNAEVAMGNRRRAIERQAANLKIYVQTCMEIASIDKISCEHFSVALQNNPESVDVFEPALVPMEYMRVPEPPEPAPDKTAIKAAINRGIDVPGAKLVRGKRLVIK